MNIDEYMQLFDTNFGTDLKELVKNNKFKMLEWAFNNLGEELYSPSQKYKEISKKKIDISNRLDSTLTTEQMNLLEKYLELDSKMSAEIEQQLLIFGFCLCYEQLKEMGALK